MKISWWQRVVRRMAVLGFITAMIVFWAIPVAFVGLISNITYLEGYSWLHWLTKIPPSIMGVISGLLPAVMLSFLMSLVPVVMRRQYIHPITRSAANIPQSAPSLPVNHHWPALNFSPRTHTSFSRLFKYSSSSQLHRRPHQSSRHSPVIRLELLRSLRHVFLPPPTFIYHTSSFKV